MPLRTLAIVVTFLPDLDQLSALLERLHGQVDGIVVTDNGSGGRVARLLRQRGRSQEYVIDVGHNIGIAAAQNLGIGWARKNHFEAVILLDQDSLPARNMLEMLHIALAGLAKTVSVACVGPRYNDPRSEQPAYSAEQPTAPFRTDFLIASGMLIPLTVLDIVGEMCEPLFIDYVDVEWCLRAATCGFGTFMVPAAAMQHQIGEPVKLGSRTVPIHGPMRSYYLYRNSIWLLRQRSISLGWRFAYAPRIALRLGFVFCFGRPVLQQWRMIGRGVWHGLTGRMGKRHD